MFYNELLDYLEIGYARTEKRKDRTKGLGLVMSVFQKIASSSFAALGYTIRRRLIFLLILEILDTPYRSLDDLGEEDSEEDREALEKIWR